MTASVFDDSRVTPGVNHRSGEVPSTQGGDGSQLVTGEFPVAGATSTIVGEAAPFSGDGLPQDSHDAERKTGDGAYVSVWSPFIRLIIGLGIVIAALTWSLHFSGAIDKFGYVPVMLVYLIIMIIGGGTMVSGAKTLWDRLTTAS